MDKKNKTVGYKSCMKIDGVPILPPLMTESKRKEMAYYKELAIAVELRLKMLKGTTYPEETASDETLKNKSNFYNCGDHNYKLVFADPEIQTDINDKESSSSSESDNDNNLVTTVSCPNQICTLPYLDKNDSSLDIEVRNFSSEPLLVRSNSYTLDHPSPMLKAQLEQLGIYENYKSSKEEKTDEQIKDNIGGCGDNICQTKIGVKRKLPMKYSELDNYNGYSEPPTSHYNEIFYSDDEINIIDSHKDQEFEDECKETGMIYEENTDIETSSDDEENIQENPTETEKSVIDNSDTSKSYGLSFPASTQKSIQNLFETIQNNHTMQMQKLMEQQKIDQELLRQAFEKQQSLLLNEIHRSYSLSKVRNDLENLIINPDPEIPDLPDNTIYTLENKPSVDSECTENFLRTSKAILSESGELLKRASSSIDSYIDSHCPSAKLSQDCLSNVTSSTAILCQKHDVIELSPNATLDITEIFYTPTDTPNKSSNYDYQKSMEKFADLKIEDINKELVDKISEHRIQNERSVAICSEESRNLGMSVSNCSSVHRGFNRQLFTKNDEKVILDPELELQNRAATILCAAARSFLVRRLLKTQRVVSIKRAIRETLLCALKLHGEGGIKTSDADLHRRLIQQLNTACHELHDIFFKTTIAERMRMITRDREIIVGPYQHFRHKRSVSTVSNQSNKYSVDCRQHFRHNSSRSLDKQSEPQYGKLIQRPV